MKGRTHMTDTGPADAAPLVNRAIRRDVARALTALTQCPIPMTRSAAPSPNTWCGC
ncbi:hypothetical protein [Mycolicibacterium sp. 624]|uniref:hypothetical protein n=1 Tax=Mycolicibacterium sp. 624 TaxID=3156314 RepID=UPI003393457F